MDSTSIPIVHINMWLQVFAIIISVIVAAGGGALIGVKFALKSVLKSINLKIETIEKDRISRGMIITKMQDDINLRVTKFDCTEDQDRCGKNRGERICLLSRQVETLAVEVKNNSVILIELNATFKERTKHFDSLEKTIINRANEFRQPIMEDMTA
jgi:hypothetical protein